VTPKPVQAKAISVATMGTYGDYLWIRRKLAQNRLESGEVFYFSQLQRNRDGAKAILAEFRRFEEIRRTNAFRLHNLPGFHYTNRDAQGNLCCRQ